MDLPDLLPLGQNGVTLREPHPSEIIPLPEGAHLYFLPNRHPLGIKRGDIVQAEGLPVAAILPQGYTRTLLPAYESPQNIEWLPYFGYAACFLRHDEIYVGALPTQPDRKWAPKSYSQKRLAKKIQERLAQSPENRPLAQLAKCASEYRCYTAANVFMERWEGALAVSPSCNSLCRGCISKAVDPGPPSPQERFDFVPSVEECVEIVRHHFEVAEEPIMSFGQGCEGEPSIQSNLIEKVILTLREQFPHGQFHINTNGSRPKALEKLFQAGLDSIRVSLNSVQEKWYNAYYRPTNYTFEQLRETIRVARHYGAHVSLNLLCFPGVTDHPSEIEAFSQFLETLQPNLIQMRNLNIDPWGYLNECIQEKVTGIGIAHWLDLIKREFPQVQIGNFTPYIKNRASANASTQRID